MKFKDDLVALIGHCAPIEKIEAFAEKLEGEVAAHVEWRLGKFKDELGKVTKSAKADAADAKPDAASK